MVRNYNRKTSKGADSGRYTKIDLQKAIDDVRNGNRTVYGAFVFYNIPRSTLRHFVFGTRGKGILSGSGKGGGGRFSLHPEVEQELSNILNTMQKWGYGLSKQEVLDLVQVYVNANSIPTKFKDGRPGDQWFLNFCNRRKLSLKKPQGVEAARKKQENPWVIFGFFDLLEQTLDDHDLRDKPDRVYNCDETSFSSDPSKTKILGNIGSKCTRTISSCGRENTTVLVCCSASGQKLPPLIIFKGKNIIESMIPEQIDPLDKTSVAASDRGWMTAKIFARWFEKCFLPNITQERPILLIVDGHVSHISCELIRKAIENNVVILKLPPHSTHILQPLDVGVFRGMKAQWDKTLCKWQRMNPRKKIPKSEFVRILGDEFEKMPVVNITNAFKATGIYNNEVGGPDRKQISNDIFLQSDLAKYQHRTPSLTVQEDNGNLSLTVQADNGNPILTVQEVNSNPSLTAQEDNGNLSLTVQKDNGNIVETLELTENASSLKTGSNNNNDFVPKPGPSNADSQNGGQNNNTNLENGVPNTSFQDILLSLLQNKADNNKQNASLQPKRKRLCVGAEILTTEEYFKRKEKEHEEKELKERIKIKKNDTKLLKMKNQTKILSKEKSKMPTKLTIANKRKMIRSSSESSDSSSKASLEKELEENYIDEEYDVVDEEFLSLQEDKDLNDQDVPVEFKEAEADNKGQKLQEENILQN